MLRKMQWDFSKKPPQNDTNANAQEENNGKTNPPGETQKSATIVKFQNTLTTPQTWNENHLEDADTNVQSIVESKIHKQGKPTRSLPESVCEVRAR